MPIWDSVMQPLMGPLPDVSGQRTAAGEGLSSRLGARADGLVAHTLPGGGQVHKGDLAREALRAVGARAMTMDHTIYVDDHFDVNKPEDQALYAHEAVHMAGSGGADAGAHGEKDAEEVAARATESMVLHRAQAGEALGSIMGDVNGGGAAGAAGGAGGGTGHTIRDSSPASEGEEAIAMLMAGGKSIDDIIRELKDHVVEHIQSKNDTSKLNHEKNSNHSGPSDH